MAIRTARGVISSKEAAAVKAAVSSMVVKSMRQSGSGGALFHSLATLRAVI